MEKATKKLVFMGRPEVGKSSIKQVVFEGKLPQDLLENPLKPTRGLNTNMYTWLDLECNTFDTAGQTEYEIFENEKKQNMIFGECDFLLYVFDAPSWNNPETKVVIIEDIKNIQKIIEEKDFKTVTYLIFHKIDLLEEENRSAVLDKIEEELTEKFELEIYFTSLLPGMIYSLYSTIYEILGKSSEQRKLLKEVIDENLVGLSKTMCFVTNECNSIVAQASTEDFDISYINYTHNLIAQMNLTLEAMKAKDKVKHLILQTLEDFNVIMNYLNLSEFDLKNLICISETITSNKLIFKAHEISRLINRKIKFG